MPSLAAVRAPLGGLRILVRPDDLALELRSGLGGPAAAMQARSRGDTREERGESFMRDGAALQPERFFPRWVTATVHEILSALHERIVVGSLT